MFEVMMEEWLDICLVQNMAPPLLWLKLFQILKFLVKLAWTTSKWPEKNQHLPRKILQHFRISDTISDEQGVLIE